MAKVKFKGNNALGLSNVFVMKGEYFEFKSKGNLVHGECGGCAETGGIDGCVKVNKGEGSLVLSLPKAPFSSSSISLASISSSILTNTTNGTGVTNSRLAAWHDSIFPAKQNEMK